MYGFVKYFKVVLFIGSFLAQL